MLLFALLLILASSVMLPIMASSFDSLVLPIQLSERVDEARVRLHIIQLIPRMLQLPLDCRRKLILLVRDRAGFLIQLTDFASRVFLGDVSSYGVCCLVPSWTHGVAFIVEVVWIGQSLHTDDNERGETFAGFCFGDVLVADIKYVDISLRLRLRHWLM